MKEIKAIEAFGTPYMTQSAEVELEQRLFVTAISSKSITIAYWRGASAEEREKWQKELDAMQAERMQMFNNIKE